MNWNEFHCAAVAGTFAYHRDIHGLFSAPVTAHQKEFLICLIENAHIRWQTVKLLLWLMQNWPTIWPQPLLLSYVQKYLSEINKINTSLDRNFYAMNAAKIKLLDY
jgi:hypothetical protein